MSQPGSGSGQYDARASTTVGTRGSSYGGKSMGGNQQSNSGIQASQSGIRASQAGIRASQSGMRASQWGKTGTGVRASVRMSSMSGVRQSGRSTMRSTKAGGAGIEMIRVVDEFGVDRTPKPLVSIRPTVLAGRGRPSMMDGSQTPESDSSDFFMDRMSSMGFSSRSGWETQDTSPRASDAGDDLDYAAQKELQKKLEQERAAQEEQEREAEKKKRAAKKAEKDEADAKPQLLSAADLDKPVTIQLVETPTIFLLDIPGVAVNMDTDEGNHVEAANKRYKELLAAKETSADRFSDAEAQTFHQMVKTAECQSAVITTAAASTQVKGWEISDAYSAIDANTEEEETNALGLTITSLAGGVAKGERRQLPGGGKQGSTANGSVAGSNSGVRMSSRNTSMAGPGGADAMRMSMSMSASAAFGVRSTLMSNMGTQQKEQAAAAIQDAAAATAPEPAPPPNPLVELGDGLLESLQLMDAVLAQNAYMPQLLQYRDVTLPADVLRGQAGGSGSEEGSPPPADDGSLLPPSMQQQQAADAAGEVDRDDETENDGASSAVSPSRSASEAATSPSPSVRASVTQSLQPESSSALLDSAAAGRHAEAVAKPDVCLLWEWVCPATESCIVLCMGWNKLRPDLLAVGYERPATEEAPSPGGLLAFWSLANPGHPLWTLATKSGVTALDFSARSPNMLAVGMRDGNIAMFDVKSRQQSPAVESDANNGRHSDPVWQVKWLDRGAEKDEALVSISTDGRVTQWSITKGLEFADIMKLKRIPRRKQQQVAAPGNGGGGGAGGKGGGQAAPAVNEQDAFISRLTSGMSFDFSPKDPRIYIAGTEDGWVHKCSTSYSEQYLHSYQGHMGPVYKLQWSPFKPDLFVSASGDWTVRMWHESRDAPLVTFQSGNVEVNDVQWCPTNATVFGAATAAGNLEIWDFAVSTLKPVATHKYPNTKLCCLLFSPVAPIVLAGTEAGVVSVLRLNHIAREYDTQGEQLQRLDEAIRNNVMKQHPGQ